MRGVRRLGLVLRPERDLQGSLEQIRAWATSAGVELVGAEGEGLRQRTKRQCDALVRIPGGQAGLESLNAGVATAVALAEVFRGREPEHYPGGRSR
jgi:tRNA G18 (ribose-2'-O)-methylase SpoU